jgi:acetyl esterase
MKRPAAVLPFEQSLSAIKDGSATAGNEHVAALLERVAQANLPPLYDMPAAAARAEFDRRAARLELAPEPVAQAEDLSVDGPEGRRINLRLYRAAGCSDAALVFYVHGGGWVFGGLDGYDPLCRRFANRIRLPLISIDYGLAPEYPAPAALEDVACVIGARAALARQAGVRTAKWAMMGDSAGGNLTAASLLALAPEDRPDHQTLIYPATDLSRTAPSRARFAEGYLLDEKMMDWFFRHYLAGGGDAADPRISPARHQRLGDSPPTLMVTAGLDPLCDEGIAYAAALHESGVTCCTASLACRWHCPRPLRRRIISPIMFGPVSPNRIPLQQ